MVSVAGVLLTACAGEADDDDDERTGVVGVFCVFPLPPHGMPGAGTQVPLPTLGTTISLIVAVMLFSLHDCTPIVV
ncbi:MAG: hypothetical protein V1926_06180 [Candidatus Peregrinibacteria bacterium]